MKMILMAADAARLPELRAKLKELGACGYSILPMLEGCGETGVHTGDRVHPGALVMAMVVAPDEQAAKIFDAVVGWRDECEDKLTKLFLVPVERQA